MDGENLSLTLLEGGMCASICMSSAVFIEHLNSLKGFAVRLFGIVK